MKTEGSWSKGVRFSRADGTLIGTGGGPDSRDDSAAPTSRVDPSRERDALLALKQLEFPARQAKSLLARVLAERPAARAEELVRGVLLRA